MPNGAYRVELANGDSALAHAGGQKVRNFVRLLPGDKVEVVLAGPRPDSRKDYKEAMKVRGRRLSQCVPKCKVIHPRGRRAGHLREPQAQAKARMRKRMLDVGCWMLV